MVDDRPAVGVVVVAYRSADELPGTLGALVPQLGERDELVIIDNASRDGTAEVARRAAPRAMVIEAGANLGFAAGANVGARATRAPLLFFLNPDARPEPGCLDALRDAALAHPDWGAWQALVLLPGGELVNTSGGMTHFLGFGWAGECEQPVARVADGPAEVSFASGASLVVRREAWERVGGFDDSYFMYGEDLDLGLRLWLAGWRVGMVPEARVVHAYEFARGSWKWFLLERNRWSTVVADYPTPVLLAVLPALLAFELALLPVAARAGWLGAKLRAQAAVVRSLPRLLRRRRRVQELRVASPRAFAAHLTATLDSPYLAAARRAPALVRLQAWYWRTARGLLPS